MNKEINIKTFLIVLTGLVIIELVVLLLFVPMKKHADVKKHCRVAICNDNRSMCFNYDLDGDNTIITWQGDCR